MVIFMRNRNRLMVTYIFSDHRSSHFETNRLKTFQLGSFVKRNFFIRLKFPSRLYPSIFWKLFQIFTRRQFIIKYISPWWNFTPNILFSFTLKIESVWNYMRIEGLEKLQKFDVAVKKKQKNNAYQFVFFSLKYKTLEQKASLSFYNQNKACTVYFENHKKSNLHQNVLSVNLFVWIS